MKNLNVKRQDKSVFQDVQEKILVIIIHGHTFSEGHDLKALISLAVKRYNEDYKEKTSNDKAFHDFLNKITHPEGYFQILINQEENKDEAFEAITKAGLAQNADTILFLNQEAKSKYKGKILRYNYQKIHESKNRLDTTMDFLRESFNELTKTAI